MSTVDRARLQREIERRRTFAIISHPDAGKTTLTEKLLLYSGLIRTAGMVGARKGAAASSDWMGMEQERGISVTASAMQFPYKDWIINVLDTPGHQDFSEDTYRTLCAADSVIMVIDAAKGVEAQTRKLFDACRLRNIPVLTFVNKMDTESRDPLDLMAEVEEVLGIQATARNWPIGRAKEFQGVVDRRDDTLLLYTATGTAGKSKPDCERVPLAEAAAHPRIGADLAEQLEEELMLLDEAGNPYTHEAYLNCEVSPVFFGSALTNFGVEALYDCFVDIAPCPQSRHATTAEGDDLQVPAEDPAFSAFVFKMQANMNPKHRDCVAFLRINAGAFQRDLPVKNQRSGKKFNMPNPHTLVVKDRSTITEAWPGDIIGIVNRGQFAIGDTITESGDFSFDPLPFFQPELFVRVRPRDLGKHKPFAKGIEQLVNEGTVQRLTEARDSQAQPIIAAVGQLQFDVLRYRLEDEYNVAVQMDPLPYRASAWVEGDIATFKPGFTSLLVTDSEGRAMVLFESPWHKDHVARENPEHRLLDYA